MGTIFKILSVSQKMVIGRITCMCLYGTRIRACIVFHKKDLYIRIFLHKLINVNIPIFVILKDNDSLT